MSDKKQVDLLTIPDKMFYKIKEVASFVGVQPYVLRYWEQEFEILEPKKNLNGQRSYTSKDINQALEIKKLLYEEKYSIAGAKLKLGQKQNKTKKVKKEATIDEQLLAKLKAGLSDILERLENS
ncbi:MAG: MerR family transcriptional regulator [Nitrospinota bacterium]